MWDCTTGVPQPMCCTKGFSYNPDKALCEYDPGCDEECFEDDDDNRGKNFTMKLFSLLHFFLIDFY